jgi:hypothetical protein
MRMLSSVSKYDGQVDNREQCELNVFKISVKPSFVATTSLMRKILLRIL